MANMPTITEEQMKNICTAKIGLEVLSSVMELMSTFKKFSAVEGGGAGSPQQSRYAMNSAIEAMLGINWYGEGHGQREDQSLYALLTTLADRRIGMISERGLKNVGNVMREAADGPLEAVFDVVKKADEVRKLINRTGNNLNLRADIHNLANAIGIDNETFTIENEPIHFTINLDLKMDADQIATRLSRTSEYQTVRVTG